MQIRVDRPSGYACRCAQITRFGTASGDRNRALVADQNGGCARVLPDTHITQRACGQGMGAPGSRTRVPGPGPQPEPRPLD